MIAKLQNITATFVLPLLFNGQSYDCVLHDKVCCFFLTSKCARMLLAAAAPAEVENSETEHNSLGTIRRAKSSAVKISLFCDEIPLLVGL